MLKEFCSKVASDCSKDEFAQIDITIILTIVLFVLQNCVLNKSRVSNPSLMDKLRLKMIVRKHTKKVREVTNSLLKEAATLTDDDINVMKGEA